MEFLYIKNWFYIQKLNDCLYFRHNFSKIQSNFRILACLILKWGFILEKVLARLLEIRKVEASIPFSSAILENGVVCIFVNNNFRDLTKMISGCYSSECNCIK